MQVAFDESANAMISLGANQPQSQVTYGHQVAWEHGAAGLEEEPGCTLQYLVSYRSTSCIE